MKNYKNENSKSFQDSLREKFILYQKFANFSQQNTEK